MDQLAILLTCLNSLISSSTLKQLSIISAGMLCMTGKVTMLGISRWTEQGGSYRTIQRFFKKTIPWDLLNWSLIKSKISQCGVVLIAGDATTVTKSGKKTYGIGRFFSSIYSRAVPGIAFQVLSLIDVEKRQSSPILVEQMISTPKPNKPKITKTAVKKAPGRPKGSKNKNKTDVVLNSEMTQVKAMLIKLMDLIGSTLKPIYFVYDGAFGNNAAVQMVRQVGRGLHLISKLQKNSKLYLPWTGKNSGKGRPRVYGKRLDYKNIPDVYLHSTEEENDMLTQTYQLQVLHKNFAVPLNVVIICNRNTRTGAQAHVILFSTDLNLSYLEIMQYYELRFQIEFNFRDAKQHWGLEDFMVTEKQAVMNSANIAFWMVNVSQQLLPLSNAQSILDLKASRHGIKYAREVFKLLPKNVQAINNSTFWERISTLGRIHDLKIAS